MLFRRSNLFVWPIQKLLYYKEKQSASLIFSEIYLYTAYVKGYKKKKERKNAFHHFHQTVCEKANMHGHDKTLCDWATDARRSYKQLFGHNLDFHMLLPSQNSIEEHLWSVISHFNNYWCTKN